MKEIIKNCVKIIIFIVLFFALFLTLNYMKKPNSIDLQNITGFYAEEKNSLDMVYLGGSAAFVYFEPLKAYEEYGIASYNFAANTMQAELYEYMIKEVMRRQTPELLVIDARAFQYRDSEQPPTSVAYRNVLSGTQFNKNKIEFIEENVPKFLNEETKSYHFDLALYHTADGYNNLETTFNMIFNKNKNDLKGFYFVPKAKRMKKVDFKTEKQVAPSNDTINILNSLLSYLKTLDTEVLFVVSPYIQSKTEKEVLNYVKSFVEDYHFDFLDSNEYYDEMGVDFDTDFYNYLHMNIYGAEKYTKFLSEYIKENYDLEDRRNDKNYSEWNELLPNWNNLVNDTKTQINAKIEGLCYDEEIFIR